MKGWMRQRLGDWKRQMWIQIDEEIEKDEGGLMKDWMRQTSRWVRLGQIEKDIDVQLH